MLSRAEAICSGSQAKVLMANWGSVRPRRVGAHGFTLDARRHPHQRDEGVRSEVQRLRPNAEPESRVGLI